MANSTRPAEFIYDNMMIHGTVVHAAKRIRRRRSCCTSGSSCIYPRQATQPITEDQLLTGPLEPTNEWYAIAKIAGIKLCQAYRQPVRVRLHLGDADQPVRPERQLRPHLQPRAAGADPQVPRRTDRRVARGRDLGHRLADARVPPRRRPRRRLPVPDGELQRRLPHQRRHRRRPADPRTRREGSRRRLPGGRRCVSTRPSPTARHARCSTSRKLNDLGWSPSIDLDTGIRTTYQWFLEQHADNSAVRGLSTDPAPTTDLVST